MELEKPISRNKVKTGIAEEDDEPEEADANAEAEFKGIRNCVVLEGGPNRSMREFQRCVICFKKNRVKRTHQKQKQTPPVSFLFWALFKSRNNSNKMIKVQRSDVSNHFLRLTQEPEKCSWIAVPMLEFLYRLDATDEYPATFEEVKCWTTQSGVSLGNFLISHMDLADPVSMDVIKEALCLELGTLDYLTLEYFKSIWTTGRLKKQAAIVSVCRISTVQKILEQAPLYEKWVDKALWMVVQAMKNSKPPPIFLVTSIPQDCSSCAPNILYLNMCAETETQGRSFGTQVLAVSPLAEGFRQAGFRVACDMSPPRLSVTLHV